MDLINRFVISSAAALAAMPLALLAEALPTDPLERQCWLLLRFERDSLVALGRERIALLQTADLQRICAGANPV